MGEKDSDWKAGEHGRTGGRRKSGRAEAQQAGPTGQDLHGSGAWGRSSHGWREAEQRGVQGAWSSPERSRGLAARRPRLLRRRGADGRTEGFRELQKVTVSRGPGRRAGGKAGGPSRRGDVGPGRQVSVSSENAETPRRRRRRRRVSGKAARGPAASRTGAIPAPPHGVVRGTTGVQRLCEGRRRAEGEVGTVGDGRTDGPRRDRRCGRGQRAGAGPKGGGGTRGRGRGRFRGCGARRDASLSGAGGRPELKGRPSLPRSGEPGVARPLKGAPASSAGARGLRETRAPMR